eukprot:TRINITY_DN529_c0_g2_i1.p1 TRINITY_DN529_c0_g2~~TRINITY_DN529_c0_g2_i1.p1  ORF type:complete len:330 (-),score=59.39 TRINITY_DN529_c0_g2_i1:1610-2488(-)
MATIPLRPSIFSLLITFVSVLTELALLSSLLLLNTLFQCRQLSRGAVVGIARHRKRNTLIALFCMLLFVLVEILASSNTVTVFATLQSQQRCTVLAPLLPGRADEAGAEAALFSCIQVNGTVFTVFAANHSEVDRSIRCANSFSFRYVNQLRDEQKLGGEGAMHCTLSGFCAIARARGTTLYISQPFQPPAEDADQSQLLEFLPTELAFDAAPHLAFFARRAAHAFEENAVEELDVRRFVIMGSRADTCTFESTGAEHTQLPQQLAGRDDGRVGGVAVAVCVHAANATRSVL